MSRNTSVSVPVASASADALWDIIGITDPLPLSQIRPGVIVHHTGEKVDGLLENFARTLRRRGFSIVGYVQRNARGCSGDGFGCNRQTEFVDLGNGAVVPSERADTALLFERAVADHADLMIVSRFSGCLPFAHAKPNAAEATPDALPLLTAIAGQCIHKWFDYTGRGGDMLAPDADSLWLWWGPDKLYRDLILGVARHEVRRIACGSRWIMVEGPFGTGLAQLPRSPRELLPRLPALAAKSLRDLAALAQSWDPAETALGIAAINAHYNRYDFAGRSGNAAEIFRAVKGRVVVVGAFPGIGDILPNSIIVEADPRPGEYPTVAMDMLLPGSAAAIVNATTLVNRSLPRILRLAQKRSVGMIGPGTPLTPRLHDYGLTMLGGFVVTDTNGLAKAIRAGAGARDFGQFGKYRHLLSARMPAASRH
jgi:uncharacterized protein